MIYRPYKTLIGPKCISCTVTILYNVYCVPQIYYVQVLSGITKITTAQKNTVDVRRDQWTTKFQSLNRKS